MKKLLTTLAILFFCISGFGQITSTDQNIIFLPHREDTITKLLIGQIKSNPDTTKQPYDDIIKAWSNGYSTALVHIISIMKKGESIDDLDAMKLKALLQYLSENISNQPQ